MPECEFQGQGILANRVGPAKSPERGWQNCWVGPRGLLGRARLEIFALQLLFYIAVLIRFLLL